MATGDAVRVTPADLVAHAGHVETIAGGVATAKQAGEAVQLDAGAYGRLCVVVPMLLGWLQDMVIDGIATAEDSLCDSADRLRATAGDYQTSDNAAAVRVDRAGGPR